MTERQNQAAKERYQREAEVCCPARHSANIKDILASSLSSLPKPFWTSGKPWKPRDGEYRRPPPTSRRFLPRKAS